MAATDSLGLPLSGASARAADLYRTALDGYHRFGGEPVGRQRAMPHHKSYARYRPALAPKPYPGSARELQQQM